VVNSINNLQEQTLQTARQAEGHSKWFFSAFIDRQRTYRPNSETTPKKYAKPPVSRPQKFEDAVSALLKVKPEPKQPNAKKRAEDK
jgi:hypothetical protein